MQRGVDAGSPGKKELPEGYGTLLAEIRERIRSERLRVIMRPTWLWY